MVAVDVEADPAAFAGATGPLRWNPIFVVVVMAAIFLWGLVAARLRERT